MVNNRTIIHATLWEDLLDEQFDPRVVIRIRFAPVKKDEPAQWEDIVIRANAGNHAGLFRRFRRAGALTKKEGMPVENVAGQWQLRPYVVFLDGKWRRMVFLNGEWIQCPLRS